MNRPRPSSKLCRAAVVIAGLLGSAFVSTAHAVAPPVLPIGTTTTRSFLNSTVVPISTVASAGAVYTSTITVAGIQGVTWDVDVITNLQHTFSSDIDMTLTSPTGVVVTMTTDNGAANNNVFNGTLWDDDANPAGAAPYVTNNGLVTDHNYADLVPVATLVPEESLSSMNNVSPNGVWTLTIVDDTAVDGGALTLWGLNLTIQSALPASMMPAIDITNTTVQPISSGGPSTISSTLAVASAHLYLCELTVSTALAHTFSNDLDITLTSPAGTTVTLTTDNGGPFNDVFNGTTWSSNAEPDGALPYAPGFNSKLVTDHVYAEGLVPSLSPEESFGAFIGENPNGTWTLTVSDDLTGDGGALNSWGLKIRSCRTTPTDYVPLAPARFADTRIGGSTLDTLFAGIGKLAAGATLTLPVGGRGAVPLAASAVALNVTVVGAANAGYLTVYPCGSTQPTASNLNYRQGGTIPNAVITKVGVGGAICVFSDQSVDLLVDVDGFFPADSRYRAINPARVLNTRIGGATVDGLNAGGGAVPAGSSTTMVIAGRATVPANAAAVVLNVTVTEPGAAGFVSVYPCGQPPPTASNLNFTAGLTIANLAISKIGLGGAVCLFADASTQLLVDVLGYFPVDSEFVALNPARLLDTRPGSATVDGLGLGADVRPANSITTVRVSGRGNVPANALTAVLNVTVTQAGGDGFLTVYPCGIAPPLASNLNFSAGQTIPNAVITQIGTGGDICLFTSAPVQVFADVTGYFP